jgi:hypothetical protein
MQEPSRIFEKPTQKSPLFLLLHDEIRHVLELRQADRRKRNYDSISLDLRVYVPNRLCYRSLFSLTLGFR